MEKIEFDNFVLDSINNLIQTGAFFTVKNNTNKTNTMTISWGSIGCMWFLPVFMVMVRKSRYTHELIEKANSFTVSIPVNGQLKKELTICGTKSGKQINKVDECNMEYVYVNNFETPIIKGCDLNILCKILYKHSLNPGNATTNLFDIYGKDKDYHTLYYGEIISIINSKQNL